MTSTPRSVSTLSKLNATFPPGRSTRSELGKEPVQLEWLPGVPSSICMGSMTAACIRHGHAVRSVVGWLLGGHPVRVPQEGSSGFPSAHVRRPGGRPLPRLEDLRGQPTIGLVLQDRPDAVRRRDGVDHLRVRHRVLPGAQESSQREVVGVVGIISYPLYLWHVPSSLLLERLTHLNGWRSAVAEVAFAFIAACASLYLVELPFPDGGSHMSGYGRRRWTWRAASRPPDS